MTVRAVFFDFDGTLVDTAPGLGLALNLLRQQHQLEALPQNIIRPYASHGTIGLLGIGFGLTPDHPQLKPLQEEYLAIYDDVFTQNPQLFANITGVLEELENLGVLWGVVTNKPKKYTLPIADLLELTQRAACIICGDDTVNQKPHPEPLLRACQLTGVMAYDCVYVGDAQRDVEAGIAAGMHNIIASYGYLSDTDQPHTWGADAIITTPQGLLPQLQRWNQAARH